MVRPACRPIAARDRHRGRQGRRPVPASRASPRTSRSGSRSRRHGSAVGARPRRSWETRRARTRHSTVDGDPHELSGETAAARRARQGPRAKAPPHAARRTVLGAGHGACGTRRGVRSRACSRQAGITCILVTHDSGRSPVLRPTSVWPLLQARAALPRSARRANRSTCYHGRSRRVATFLGDAIVMRGGGRPGAAARCRPGASVPVDPADRGWASRDHCCGREQIRVESPDGRATDAPDACLGTGGRRSRSAARCPVISTVETPRGWERVAGTADSLSPEGVRSRPAATRRSAVPPCRWRGGLTSSLDHCDPPRTRRPETRRAGDPRGPGWMS